jgi:putative endonuclease
VAESAAGNRGRAAEEAACGFLEERGLRPVARNFRCRQGEIDLVMAEGRTLVFVEVRYRRDIRFGSAAESVNGRKQRRIITAAQYYLQQNPGASKQPCRFDVVALGGQGEAVEWIKNAFDLS